jgi:hypothetical protein
VAAAVHAFRKDETAKSVVSKKIDDDQVSRRSAASSQQMNDTQLQSMLFNPEATIRATLQGKVIGMTDAEWSQTVNKNV